jgi:acetoin utilization deacetylase AcuC-like enzyme
VALDPDTYTSPDTYEVALLSAGAGVEMVERVLGGKDQRALALVRPPGHHAERDRAMGFCLFNNIAIGAAHLRARHRLERVMVMDWDVHHGNGTQHSFARDPGVLFVSTHRWPFYPGTGALDEVGSGEGQGFTVNLPFPGGYGDAEYAEAFHAVVAPLALEYEPQAILISAGFDPHRRDPLGGMAVTERGFAAMARSLVDVADRVCDGRVVAVLEGGYDLQATRDSTSAVLDVLCGRDVAEPPPGAPSHAGPILDAVKRQHGGQWKAL